MAVIKDGLGGTGLLAVDTATDAARVQDRPIDVGSLGAYQISYTSGTMAAGLGAAAPIFSVRWGDATRTMLVRRLAFMAQNAGTAFTAGLTTFDMIVARAFTVSDTGGAAVVLTTNQAKKRTSFGSSLVTDMRGSTTATLSAGTRTLDTLPMVTAFGAVQATATNFVFFPADNGPMTAAAIAATGNYGACPADLWYPEIGNSWPLVLVQNEGFIVRATVPATGTWRFSIQLEWAEVSATAGYN